MQRENIVFKNECLKFTRNNHLSSHYVFVSGCSSDKVYLYLNQLNKTSGIVIDKKTNKLLKKENCKLFSFKELSENSIKLNINILGHKY